MTWRKSGSHPNDYGPIVNPLPVNWWPYVAAQKAKGIPEDVALHKIVRRHALRRMRIFRSVPRCKRIWWVTLTATQAAESQFSPRELESSLAFTPQAFWLRSRRKAKLLLDLDRHAGGAGTMYAVEYRYCPVCFRLLLGPEAHDYRKKMMHPKRDWNYPAGPACNMDCKPKARPRRQAA